uniref:HMG box domain-containing protein n=1 Tax=Panagrellus redivivus TaxID=6233 RepID=A0A7E4W6G1_PANRE
MSNMFRGNQSTPNRYPEMQRFKIPETPLSPYMRFSAKNWQRIRMEFHDRPLWEVSKLVAERWRQLPEQERKDYHTAYEQERAEYEKVLRAINHNTAINQQAVIQKRQRHGGSRRADPTAGVVIQPVIDEDPYEYTPKKVSAMRFERNQRLLLELFNGVPMPDVRNFVAPGRIEALRKQSDTLETHQKRITDEMHRVEESYNKRKKALQDSTERFQAELKRTYSMRPTVDEQAYAKMVEESEKKLLAQWKAYQERQAALKQAQEAERNETPILYSLTVGPSPQTSTSNA